MSVYTYDYWDLIEEITYGRIIGLVGGIIVLGIS